MVEQNPSPAKEKRVLDPQRKDRIRGCIEMIQLSKRMITAINEAVQRSPEHSELGSEVIQLEKELISKFTKQLRRIRYGQTQLHQEVNR